MTTQDRTADMTWLEYLHTASIDLTIRADEDEQKFYVWCGEYPEVPPTHSAKLETAIRHWLEDFQSAIQAGDVAP